MSNTGTSYSSNAPNGSYCERLAYQDNSFTGGKYGPINVYYSNKQCAGTPASLIISGTLYTVYIYYSFLIQVCH